MNNELSIFAAYHPTGVDFQKVANSNGLSKLSDGNFAFYSEEADGGRNQKFAAVQGNTLISNSRDLLRSDRGPMKPLIFNWALASPGKLEWLAEFPTVKEIKECLEKQLQYLKPGDLKMRSIDIYDNLKKILRENLPKGL